VPSGDIHHWNFSKSTFQSQVFDPRNLFPTKYSLQHNTVHMNVGIGNGVDYRGPTRRDSAIEFDDSYYPLPEDYFKSAPDGQ